MIVIPNMEKPKECGDCDWIAWSNLEQCNVCDRCDGRPIPDNEELAYFCPLIELIPCKECKYSKIYALQSDAPIKRWCHRGHFPKEVTDDYFCGDGERK